MLFVAGAVSLRARTSGVVCCEGRSLCHSAGSGRGAKSGGWAVLMGHGFVWGVVQGRNRDLGISRRSQRD